jgi:hypothetical protein
MSICADGDLWKIEVVGSNPATQTIFTGQPVERRNVFETILL